MTSTDHDVVVVGAGFSGLALLYHLREQGFATHVIDGNEGIGGTWWSNVYPGVRTDSEFHYYSFSFSQEVRDEWTWSERYATGAEVREYLNFVADRLDLRKDIQLGTRVERAVWDEEGAYWRFELSDNTTTTAKHFVSGMGVLSEAIFPDIPGMDSFAGEKYHTAQWPRDGVDLTGKRVGIIGLGASGIQVVPTIAPEVEKLLVFQRTPNYVVETDNPPVSEAQMAAVREDYDGIIERAARHPFGVDMTYPDKGALDVDEEERRRVFESKWNAGGFHFANECFNDLAASPAASEEASKFIRDKIHEIVDDQSTADLLSPTSYSFNGKRVPTGHNYYATFNRDNVELIDAKSTPISEVTEKGIKVGDTEYEVDVLIFATGFDAMTGTLTSIDIVGRDGLVLRDKWAKEGLLTNLGIAVHGFPNFFMSLGPQTPYSNLVVPIQRGAQWLTTFLTWAREQGHEVVESTIESEIAWQDEADRAGNATVMAIEGPKAGAWFLGGNVPGKRRAFNVYMGGGGVYQDYCRQTAEKGYPGFTGGEAQPATTMDELVVS